MIILGCWLLACLFKWAKDLGSQLLEFSKEKGNVIILPFPFQSKLRSYLAMRSSLINLLNQKEKGRGNVGYSY
jgi:hypothetical protein